MGHSVNSSMNVIKVTALILSMIMWQRIEKVTIINTNMKKATVNRHFTQGYEEVLKLSFKVVNTRSIKTRADQFSHNFYESNYHSILCGVTDTWLMETD